MALHRVLATCLLLLAALFAQAQSRVREPKVVTADGLSWSTYPQAVPDGANVAILYGNPDSTSGGPFVMRVKVKDGAAAGPQWHTSDMHITVLQGSLTFAEGTTFEEKNAQHLTAGGYILIPRGVRYSILARSDATYQIQANGPLRTYIVKPAPRTVAAAPQPPPSPVPTEEQRQRAEFDAAVRAYNQASQSRDQTAMQSSRREFERISRGGGRYASSALEFLNTRFPVEVIQPGSCPTIPVLKERGWVVQEAKPGDVIATGLLDQRLVWTACPTPVFPKSGMARTGTVKLAATVDESGNVVNVKTRGGMSPPGYLEAASAALRQWKTNPPRSKGMPVRTEVSVDIPYSN
jgi:TonB family protein